MTTNLRYLIYKGFIALKKRIDKGSPLSTSLIKLLEHLKEFGLAAYVFYITKLKYSISSRILRMDSGSQVTTSQVNPRDIVFFSSLRFTNHRNKHTVIGGNWDRLTQRFEDSEYFHDVSEALQGAKPIEKMKSYQDVRNAFLKYQSSSMEVDALTFNERWHDLVDLYQDFENYQKKVSEDVLPTLTEIIVDIGREGDLLLADGELPLALAILFDLNSIPIVINSRHVKWMIFRRRFHDLAIRVGSVAYQPPLHPDLMYIPAEQSCLERYHIISENLAAKKGILLDLGANMGYFSIMFEDDGFECTAVEYFPSYLFCLLGQKRALNKKFTVIEGSFLEQPALLEQEYDVVLALNVFSHLIVHKETFENLDAFLGELKCKELFFEPYSPDDPQMKNSYVVYTEDEFAEYVRKKLGKLECKIIGTASDGRWIYKIS